jgi:hypothetical protein
MQLLSGQYEQQIKGDLLRWRDLIEPAITTSVKQSLSQLEEVVSFYTAELKKTNQQAYARLTQKLTEAEAKGQSPVLDKDDEDLQFLFRKLKELQEFIPKYQQVDLLVPLLFAPSFLPVGFVLCEHASLPFAGDNDVAGGLRRLLCSCLQ